MVRKPARSNMKWTKAEEARLKELSRKNVATKDMAKDLQRTESAVRSKASDLDISLKPKDPKK
ncbi:MAG: hypothetical protein VB091_10125 [Christensenella sp.]|nr:hypothetical protein [Christensenella sp.]